MEKSYSLKNIQLTRRLNANQISASVYLGERRIGSVRGDVDEGTPEFAFDLPTDRLVFEAHVLAWWETADRESLYDPDTLWYARHNPSFTPPRHAKLVFWIKSVLQRAPSHRRLKLAA